MQVQQLEALFQSFLTETDSQRMNEKDQILTQWKNDLNTIPTALEIIQKSENPNLISLSIIKIKDNFEKYYLNLQDDHYKTIYLVCFERICSNRANPHLPQNILLALFEIIAIATFLSPQILVLITNSNQFSPEELVIFFAYLLDKASYEKTNRELAEPQLKLIDFISLNIAKMFELLQRFAGPNISFPWVLLHCSLPSFMNSISDLACFLPCIQVALNNEACVPTILTFYESAVNTYISEEYLYLKELIKIMIGYAISIFAEPTDSKVLNASFIWGATIDQSFDFYSAPEIGPEFTNFVFMNFLQSFPAFLQYDLNDNFEEYFFLLDILTYCLGYQPPNMELSDVSNYISMTLDILISQIDLVSSFTSPPNRPLYPYCLYQPNMDSCLMHLMRSDPENEADINDKNSKSGSEFNQFLSYYFNQKIQNLTNGVLYAISFAPSKTRRTFASRVGIMILDMPQKLMSSVYFISQCCGFTPECQKQQVDLVFSISTLEFAPQYAVVEALTELSKVNASYFVEGSQNYVLTIEKMLEMSTANISNLFITMFNILYYLQAKFSAANQPQMIQTLNSLFDKVHLLFASKIPFNQNLYDLLDFKQFNYLVYPIIKESNNQNGLMTPYYSRLFSHIEAVLTNNQNGPPIILAKDYYFQTEICSLIKASLQNQWIVNKEPYLHWIEQILFIFPISQHLEILTFLIEFLPTPPIVSFFQGIQTFREEMLEYYVLLLIRIMSEDPNRAMNLVNIDQLLFPLSSQSFYTFAYEMQLLTILFKSPGIVMTPQNVEKIIHVVVQKAFAPHYACLTVEPAVRLLKEIGKRYNILPNTLQLIVAASGVRGPQMEKFAASYMQEDQEVLKIGIDELIRALMSK